MMPHTVAPQIATPTAVTPHVEPPVHAVAAPNVAPPNIGSPGPVGQRDVGGSLQSLIQGRNGGPILRNPAYANISTRDPAARALAQSTFGGRFAHAMFESGRHRHHFGRVIGFVGPVFWPFAYDDFIDYTFSPYAYDTFWPYAYDDVFDGIYGAYAPNTPDYASASDNAVGGTAYVYGDATNAWVMRGGRSQRAATLGDETQICSGLTDGFADFPIQRIEQQVKPDQNQQTLLGDLKLATAEALGILRAACPSDLPSTPTGRLTAVRSRVEAMLRAVRVIDPALQKFYRALSDEQKERLNALDAGILATAENPQPDPAKLCGGEAQAADLPIATIEQRLQLSEAQQTSLNALKEASVKAADVLRANCPKEPALTPTARLTVMKQRLEAMMRVLDTVQPALADFYASLDDEQKARFNRFGIRAP
jgi:hypothetical protein